MPTQNANSSFSPAQLAQFFLGTGLAAIVLGFGFIVWRLTQLPHSGHPEAEQRIASHHPAETPPHEDAVEGETAAIQTHTANLNRLFNSVQEQLRPNTEPKKPVVHSPPQPPKAVLADRDQVFEQRLQASEDDLREQLCNVPELRLLNDDEVKKVREDEKAKERQITAIDRVHRRAKEEKGLLAYNVNLRLHQAIKRGAVRAGLELDFGPSCQLPQTTATEVATLSKELRDMGFVTVPGVRRNNGGGTEFQTWCDQHRLERLKGTVPTLTQMLQIEDEPTRLLLVRELTRIHNAASTVELTMRALADLSPAVRRAALAGLEHRDSSDYLPMLLRALRYPWPPLADHAAVALRTLKPQEAVAPLVHLLDLPSPSKPVFNTTTGQYTVREMVRLNHLRNCLLCHAPSANKFDGLVRGLVPTPGQRLPRLYYDGQSGDFVRADITFLHQDFSVNLPEINAAPWPKEQRFDFVTRLRTMTPNEVVLLPAVSANYPQRDAVLYALRGLTGKDGGDSSAIWRELLGLIAQTPKSERKNPVLDKMAVSPAEGKRRR
jgi:hypothetical protein